jgi:serine/threonine-protein kinase
MEPGYRSTPLLELPDGQGTPAISPDGRWIAYRSDETGRQEIYVRPFPHVKEGMWPVTTDGGSSPVWAASGRELFYQNGESMMVIPIETGSTFSYGKPQVLFSGGYVRSYRNFDISPNGRRFLMIKDTTNTLDSSARDELTVVLNWSEELKRLARPR